VTGASAIERAARAATGRRWFWAVALAALAGWPVVHALRTRMPPQPPVLGTMPPFGLLDQDGRRFGSDELAGRVWIASLVATRGEGCSGAVGHLARIQARARNLEPALHLVSFTADPEHDTPARLAAYARARRASPRMWTFVTGPGEAVRAAAEQGLGLRGCGPGARGASLVLVDGGSRIRGTYLLDEPGAADRVVRDAALLVNRR
jgi:protein SCO1/2